MSGRATPDEVRDGLGANEGNLVPAPGVVSVVLSARKW
jgi:hypothetical protein